MDTIKTDERDCLSDSHLEFMRAFILREDELGKAAVERFLKERSVQGKAAKKAVARS
jgi:hypothetical protein